MSLGRLGRESSRPEPVPGEVEVRVHGPRLGAFRPPGDQGREGILPREPLGEGVEPVGVREKDMCQLRGGM